MTANELETRVKELESAHRRATARTAVLEVLVEVLMADSAAERGNSDQWIADTQNIVSMTLSVLHSEDEQSVLQDVLEERMRSVREHLQISGRLS